uniref:Chemokine interleukin-8-like domain-containing protein n=1 Tax=Gasterosteus aculeatus aculeatus TaxID=481459 RepID=A0AAQ4PA33_GASAC
MKNPGALMTCALLFSSLAAAARRGSFGPDECCFAASSTRLRENNVLSYKFTDGRCSREGVFFTVKNGAKSAPTRLTSGSSSSSRPKRGCRLTNHK